MTTEARLPSVVEPGFVASDDVWASLAERVDDTKQRPKLAADIELVTHETADGTDYVMVANPRDLIYFRLTTAEAALLPELDGTRSVGELVVERLRSGGEFDVATVVELVKLLEDNGFLEDRPPNVETALDKALHPPTLKTRLAKLARTLSVEWSGAERLVQFLYRNVLRWLYTRVGLALAALTVVGGVAAMIDVSGRHTYHLTNRHFGVTFMVLMALDLLIIFIHELGHASVLVHYKRRVKSAGFRLYFGTPSFFIESSDALMLSRGKRIQQSAAGPGLELLGTSIASILLWLFPVGAAGQVLFQFCLISYYVLFLNLVPLLELDGYWILSDWLRQPDLRPDSLAFVRHDLGRKLVRRERFSKRELGLALYGSVGVLFTIASLGSAWFFWRRVFGNTIASLWDGGLGGRVLLLVLGLALGGPAIHAAVIGVRGIVRSIRSAVDRLRFRAERQWRVEAATLLDGSAIFGDVPVEVLNDLAGRISLRTYRRGERVFSEGDPADAYFIVRKGRFEISETEGEHTRSLRIVAEGDGFGHYGLLTGAKRTATVRALDPGELFVLDKGTFDRLLADRAVPPEFALTLQQVNELRDLRPFRHLSSAEIAHLAGHGKWLVVAPGQEILREGESADAFYVVESGQLDVLEGDAVVDHRTAGDHVGEIGLLLDVPRTATVRAATATRLFELDRDGFHSLVASQFRRGSLAMNTPIERIRDH